MDAVALALVLTAAVAHAGWNLLAKTATGGARLIWLFGLTSGVLMTPFALVVLLDGRDPAGPGSASWPSRACCTRATSSCSSVATLDHIAGLRRVGPRTPYSSDARIVYSPLHGVGARFTLAAFDRAGLAPPIVVDAQREPDGAFPTVAAPNPEDPDATLLALDEAMRHGAVVALVHDPDADRLGVLAPMGGAWRALTGNEIGLLLADHILTHSDGDDRLVVDTVVSSSALARLAAAHQVHHVRTLTGFKWIVRPAIDNPHLRFVFGYEEALGFSVDDYVRDKDGISAAVSFADLVDSLATNGQTVADRLEALAVRHGLFLTATWTLASHTPRAIDHVMDDFASGCRRALDGSRCESRTSAPAATCRRPICCSSSSLASTPVDPTQRHRGEAEGVRRGCRAGCRRVPCTTPWLRPANAAR